MQEVEAVQAPNGKLIQVFKGGFVKLEEVSTDAATPSTVTYENVKKNVLLKLPKIEKLPEYQKIKGYDTPIAIVGGGPSLKKHINELKEFRTIIACGSVHDYLRSEGIVPTYAAICDPDLISVNYYKNLHTETKYLLSTGVDPKLIEHFKDHQIVLWHCHSTDYNIKEIEEIEGINYHAISGGCTVGLRAINIAIMMGYNNIHFFGFDSCMSDEECHAYAVSEEEKAGFGRLFAIKLRNLDGEGPADRVYMCVGYQLAQAHAFREFYFNFGRIFNPTFHGDGLMPNLHKLMLKVLNVEIEQPNKEQLT